MRFDLERFIELFSHFTGISESRLSKYLDCDNHRVSDLLHRPTDIAENDTELKAIEGLRELRNIYDVLKFNKRVFIKSPKDILTFVNDFFSDRQDKEYFSVIFLDTKNQVIDVSTTAGTVNTTTVFPREIIKDALFKNASFLILVHNHPSGDPEPSSEDFTLTNIISVACHTVRIPVLDHVIVGNSDYFSFKSNATFCQSLNGSRLVSQPIRSRSGEAR